MAAREQLLSAPALMWISHAQFIWRKSKRLSKQTLAEARSFAAGTRVTGRILQGYFLYWSRGSNTLALLKKTPARNRCFEVRGITLTASARPTQLTLTAYQAASRCAIKNPSAMITDGREALRATVALTIGR